MGPVFPAKDDAELMRMIFELVGGIHEGIWPGATELPKGDLISKYAEDSEKSYTYLFFSYSSCPPIRAHPLSATLCLHALPHVGVSRDCPFHHTHLLAGLPILSSHLLMSLFLSTLVVFPRLSIYLFFALLECP